MAAVITNPQHINRYRAVCTKAAIEGWIKFKIIPKRGVTISKLLKIAAEYTGKQYNTKQAALALADLISYLA